MKKVNEKAVASTATETVNTVNMTNEEIVATVEANVNDRYSNWGADRTIKDEENELKGLDLIKGVDERFIRLNKFWHNRTKYREVYKEIKNELEAQGIDIVDWMQTTVRPQVEENDMSLIIKALSRMKYALNYHKPREGQTRKANLITIKIDGNLYQVDKLKLSELKTTITDRDELKAKLIEVAKPIETTEELEF